MNLLDRYLERTEFGSYEDFKNNYRLKIPEGFNFGFDIVDVYADETPDKPALVYRDDFGGSAVYTFSDVKRESDLAAAAFYRLGIRSGDRVMLILKQRPQTWFYFVALCKLGAIFIPATFQLTPKDIAYRCESASVSLICAVSETSVVSAVGEAMSDPAYASSMHGVRCALVGEPIPGYIDMLAEVEASDGVYPPANNRNSDIMMLYFSSGTSGMPKMIAHNYTYPLGHITTAKYWQHVEDDGLHMTVSDSGWAKFAWGKIFGQWIAGTAIAAYDEFGKFRPDHLLDVMEELRLTTFCAPPTIYRYLIKENLASRDLSSIHHCCTAGEPLSPEVVLRFKEATGLTIHEGFGQTETSVLLANFGWDEIKPGSTGKPAPIYDIDIVDDNGVSCEDGIVGRIVIKNAGDAPCGLFSGYVSPDGGAGVVSSHKNGVYDTGDMAWRDSEGYFRFEGRSDDVIKCSGYRIGPFEVESALISHPSVLECAVTAVPDPIRGQVVKASIVLCAGYEPSDELIRELQNHVKKTTAPYKYPRVVEFVRELPKTTSGKIRRAEIRRADSES